MRSCPYVCLSVNFTFTPRNIPVGYKDNKKQHKKEGKGEEKIDDTNIKAVKEN